MINFKIFCINLIEREDRYNFMKIQFEKIHNYPIEFVRNNKHIKGGRYGCFESHIQCIKMALKQNLDYCLVLEDDCVLAENFISTLKECESLFIQCKENGKKLDIIYSHDYGCMYLDKKISDNIYRGKFLGGACICIGKNFMKKILKEYQKYIDTYHYDFFLTKISTCTFINLNYMVNLSNFSSDNDPWSKNNFLINYAQQITEFTTTHTSIHHNSIICICKLLLDYNENYLLKKFIEQTINFYSENLK